MSCECTDNIIIPYVKPEDIVAVPVETPTSFEYASAVAQINQAKTSVETTKTEAITAISSAKTESITAIQQQGATTLASIPADYSSLSGQIAKLQELGLSVENGLVCQTYNV